MWLQRIVFVLRSQCRTTTSSGVTGKSGMRSRFTGDTPLFFFLWQLKVLDKFHFCAVGPVCGSHAEPCDVRVSPSHEDIPTVTPSTMTSNNKIVQELVKQPDNSRCADCGAAGKRRVCDPTSATNYLVNLKISSKNYRTKFPLFNWSEWCRLTEGEEELVCCLPGLKGRSNNVFFYLKIAFFYFLNFNVCLFFVDTLWGDFCCHGLLARFGML